MVRARRRQSNGRLFSYVDLELRVRPDHPLRAIRTIVNESLSTLEREFTALYSPIGLPSIPLEKLLRAMLLQAFYSIRSERLLLERLVYDLWSVGITSRRQRRCPAPTRQTDPKRPARRSQLPGALRDGSKASFLSIPRYVRSTP
jgi:hypothetical protein